MNRIIILIILINLTSAAVSQENLRIKKISFKGNSVFNNLKLKEQLSLKPSSFFKEKLLKQDPNVFSENLLEDDIKRLKNFYQKEGYLKIQIPRPTIIVTKNNKVHLVFNVIEGNPIIVESVDYKVDSAYSLTQVLPKKELRNLRLRSQLRPNSVFKDEWFIKDRQLINYQFNNIGFAFAQTDYSIEVDTIAYTAKIKWLIDQGHLTRFGKTNISGNKKVPEKKVRRQLTYHEGDVWSRKKLDLSQKRIFNLGMFRVSSLKTISLNEQNDTLPIEVNLKEAPVWTTRFGVGYGREDKFRVFGELQKLGFITKTGRINLYAKHSALEPYNFNLKFIQPAVVFPINSLIINPYVQMQNEPGYTIDKSGYNLTFLQNFSDHFNTNVTLFFEDVQQDTTDLFLIDKIDLPESVYVKSGISFGFTFFNGEPKLDPINGHSISLNIKTNGLYVTRDMPFFRSLMEYKKYWGLNYGLTLAFKGKLGIADATDGSEYLPPEERFYAGGAHSVRGWSRSELGPKDNIGRPLGGKSLLEGSVEARINLTPNLIFAGFIDTGNVWEPSFTYNVKDLAYSIGAGIRYNTPIGPAGLDFARPIFNEKKTWQIHFNIGHPF